MSRPRRPGLRRGMIAVALVLLLGIFAAPASADTVAISNTAYSTTTWQTGTYSYWENHTGDDFAIRIDSGPSLDVKWVTCDGNSMKTGYVTVTSGNTIFTTVGTDFYAGTCLHLMFKGHSSTGTWSGVAWWNYSWI